MYVVSIFKMYIYKDFFPPSLYPSEVGEDISETSYAAIQYVAISSLSS